EGIGAGARDRFSQLEEAVIFDLAEILRGEQFLRAEDLPALLGCLFEESKLLSAVGRRVGRAAHLREADLDDAAVAGVLLHLIRIYERQDATTQGNEENASRRSGLIQRQDETLDVGRRITNAGLRLHVHFRKQVHRAGDAIIPESFDRAEERTLKLEI